MASVLRFLRYLAPNAVTAFGLVCGLASLWAAHQGRLRDAAWLIAWAVLTDKLDGTVARRLRATSGFGVQADSFADCVAFGVAPPFLALCALGSSPHLPFASGAGFWLLAAVCTGWTLAAVFRLARFNVIVADDRTKGIFFGVPTTAAAGLFALWFLVLLKYGDPASSLAAPASFGEKLVLGELRLGPWTWEALVAGMALLAFLMASSVKIPKLQRLPSRAVTAFVFASVAWGYVLGFARAYPELIVWFPSGGLLGFYLWGLTTPRLKGAKPPALFGG
jgi:CDP-diacylglycerol---serine O-phosphatidyltransferase